MEYRIEASVVLEPAYVARLIMAWYRGPVARSVSTATAFRPHTSQVPGTSTSQRFGAFTSGANVRPGSLTGTTAAERASASFDKRHISQEKVNTFPVATQPAITRSETNFSVGSNVRLRKISSLGDFHNDYFFWGDNQVLVLDRLSGRSQWFQLKAGWNNPQAANPQIVSLGRFRADGSMITPVDQMTDAEKLAEATRRAIPGIVERGGEAVQEYIESLLEPDTVAQMLVLTSVSVVFPIVGIGFAIAGVYYLGEDAVVVLENLVSFVRKAKTAQNDTDLNEAANWLEVAIVKSGGIAWNVLLKKKRQTRQLVRAERNSGSRSTLTTPRNLPEIGKPVKPRQVSAAPTPQSPSICASVQIATNGTTKQERYNARMAVIAAARKRPDLSETTDRFELNNRAIERARLSHHVYNINKKIDYIKPKTKELEAKQEFINFLDKYLLLSMMPNMILMEKYLKYSVENIKEKIAKYADDDNINPPSGWTVAEQSEPGEDPAYAVYLSNFENPPVPVLVFRGTDTDVSAWSDWVMTNIPQGLGSQTKQYNKSIDIAKQLQEKYKKLEIAGHSKGGGQAAAAAIVSGAKAYTFNAVGVHHRTVERLNKALSDASNRTIDGKPLVDAFNFPFEFLTATQDTAVPAIKSGLIQGGKVISSLPVLQAEVVGTSLATLGYVMTMDQTSPSASGVRHTVPAQDIHGNLIQQPSVLDTMKRIDYHSMPYLIDSMERQKQDDLKTIAQKLGCK